MEIRNLVTSFGALFIISLFGNANGQGGLPLVGGGDFIMDTPFGELPRPLVASMAGSGGVGNEINTGQAMGVGTQPGGGFGNQALLSLFHPSSEGHLSLDPSSIAGVTNGQTIYLPGNLRDRFMSGLLNTFSVPVAPESTMVGEQPNTQFTLQNEEFTALGDVGHLIRVPNAHTADKSGGLTTTVGAPADLSALSSAKVTINGKPIEIIGVADMNQLDQSGNPQFFSFNPGTGNTAEIQALQSALMGTAVDMSSFIPPPYASGTGQLGDPGVTPSADGSVSSPSVSTSVTTVETIETNIVNETSSSANTASSSSASSSASTAIDAIDHQLDMLLSQGHSQANSQNDISAIMGQIGTAMNDINKKSDATKVLTDTGSIVHMGPISSGRLSTVNTGFNIDLVGTDPGPPSITNVEYSPGAEVSQKSSKTTVTSDFGSNFHSADLNPLADSVMRKIGSGNVMASLDSMTVTTDMSPKPETAVLGDISHSTGTNSIGTIVETTGRLTEPPHVNDFTNQGIYPFEGNMAAREAVLMDGAPILTGMNNVIKTKTQITGNIPVESVTRTQALSDKSRLSTTIISAKPTNEIAFKTVTGTSAAGGGTGIFAVSSPAVKSARRTKTTALNALSPMSNSFVIGAERFTFASNSALKPTPSSSRTASLSSTRDYAVTQSGSGGSTTGITQVSGNAYTNLGILGTSQNNNVIIGGKGTNTNAINASSRNFLAAKTITNNQRSADIADAAPVVPMTGSNGGPITNLDGLKAPVGEAVTILKSEPVPSGSFVIGAGQPNPTIINTGPVSASDAGSFSINTGLVGTSDAGSLSINTGPVSASEAGSFPINTGPVGTSDAGSFSINTGPVSTSGAGSFSLSSKPDMMGTFSMGNVDASAAVSDTTSTTGIAADLPSNIGGVQINPGLSTHDILTNITETTITEETITTHESSSSATGASASSSSQGGVSISSDMGTSPNMGAAITVGTGLGNPVPAESNSLLIQTDIANTNTNTGFIDTSSPTTGNIAINSISSKFVDQSPGSNAGFAIGSGSNRGDLSMFNQISLPDQALQPRVDQPIHTELVVTTEQKPVDMTSFVPPPIDAPRASPLVAARLTSNPRLTPETMLAVDASTQFEPTASVIVGTGKRNTNDAQTSSSSSSSRISIGSGLSVSPNVDSPGLPAKVTDQSKVIDLTKSMQISPGSPLEFQALESRGSTNVPTINGLDLRQSSKPIVGSVFQSTGEATSNRLTQKFLEQSGITQQPSMDFMATFLNQENKPLPRPVSVGGKQKQLRIVPLRSSPTTNMFVVGTGAPKSDPLVDRFGVADITTRKQQLNPNQWTSFISAARSHDNRPRSRYLTQNVLGASETRPLNGNSQTSIVIGSGGQKTHPTSNTKSSSNSGLTVFEAPGMTGHRSVSVSSFNTPNSMNASPQISQNSIQTSSVSSGVAEQMLIQDPVANAIAAQQPADSFAPQATAIKTSEFANNFKRTLGSSGIPISGPNFLPNIQDQNAITSKIDTSVGSLNSAISATFGIPSSSSTFTVGDSLTVSDNSVQTGNINRNLQGPISTTNIERMQFGEPVILNKVGSTNQLSGLDAMANSIRSTPEAASGFIVKQNMNSLLSNKIGTLTPVSNTPVVMDSTLPRNQHVQATQFTSGNRFAVFGPANDVSGRSFRTRAPARPSTAVRIGVLAPVVECRYRPDPISRNHFIYRNGLTEHRFRCALGTAFDEMTCECSIRVSDHDDCLEVHMDFNNGVVEDSSLNRLPIGNENVEITNSSSPLSGIALFGGDGKLTIWRYQNYDFRDHVMLKVQFRPGPGGDRFQSLISNCGREGPSIAIIYDSKLKEVLLFLKTSNDTQKELSFKVNTDEWNDVTYIYDGQVFIGIVNGVRRYISRQDPHLLGIIGGEIKSVPTQGLIEIRDAAIVLGQCHQYGNFIGAMVDIQVYTCIPKDFRLE